MEASGSSGGGRVEPMGDSAPMRAQKPTMTKEKLKAGISKWLEEQVENDMMSSIENRAYDLLKGVEDWWQYDATEGRVAQENHGLKETLETMQKSIDKLEKKMDSKPTYAAALQAGGLKGSAAAAIQRPLAAKELEERRRAKTLVVSITDPKEKAKILLETPKEILEKAGKAMGEDNRPAGLRKLQSGDLAFVMASEKEKNKWEATPSWAAVIASSATVKKRTFKVMVHGVRMINVNVALQAEAINSLIAQNSRIHKDLRIIKVSWLTSAVKNKKAFSSLIVETPCAKMANDIIELGFIEDHELKLCELFDVRSRPIQCFKCYQWGHFSSNCRNAVRCGHCAGSHHTDSCTTDEAKCAACGCVGHKAWAKECQIKKDLIAKRAAEGTARPVLYTVTAPPATPRVLSPIAQEATRGQKRAQTMPPEVDSAALNTPGGLNPEWQKAYSGRASGPPEKKQYVPTKIADRKQREKRIVEEL